MNKRQREKCLMARKERRVAGLIYDDIECLGKPETPVDLAAEITNTLSWHSLYGRPYIRRLLTYRKGWISASRRCVKLAFR